MDIELSKSQAEATFAAARAKADAAGLPIVLAGMLGGKRYGCRDCQREVVGFKDRASAQEYRISGLCQACQDTVFRNR